MSTRSAQRLVRPALVAGTVVLLLVGVSVLASGSRSDGEPATTVSAPSAASAEVRTAAREVFEAFSGTPEQQNAGLVLRAHALNGAMDECMAQQGYPEWDWSLARTYAHQDDPFGVTAWFTDPELRQWSENLLAMKPYMAAEEAMNSDELDKGTDEASGRCLNTVAPASDAEVDAVTEPAVAAKLRDAWNNRMADLALQLGGDPTKLYRCVSAAEVPQLGGKEISSADALDMIVSASSPDPGDIPASAGAASKRDAEWQEFLDTETDVMAAVWRCRGDVYNQNIDAFARPVADFSATYGDEITQAQVGWRQIEEEAAELGYRGQVGPLGK